MKVLLATLALYLTLNAQERFKSGLWQLTSAGGDNPGTTTVCMAPVSTSPVNGPPASVRANAEKSAAANGMKITSYSFDGTTISMTMTSGSNIFTSKASYRGDTYENTIVSKSLGRETIKTIKGKRVGPCP